MSGRNIKVAASDGGEFNAYLASPASRPGPAIVVLQEIFGVNADIRGIADRFASKGYFAIAPDLFWRQQVGVDLNPTDPTSREPATKLMKGLNETLAVDDAAAAMEHVRGVEGCSGRVGAVGYCLGGKLAYLLATRPGLGCAVSYYGVGIHDVLDQAPGLRCRLLLHIAGADPLCPPDAQAKIKEAMALLGPQVIIADYPGAGHAFARSGGATYAREHAAHAETATDGFLAAELGLRS